MSGLVARGRACCFRLFLRRRNRRLRSQTVDQGLHVAVIGGLVAVLIAASAAE